MSFFTNDAWRARAGCKNLPSSTFFPETRKNANQWRSPNIDKAKKVCSTCPVIKDCFKFALDNGETFGVWAGVNFIHTERMGEQKRRDVLTKRYTSFMCNSWYPKQRELKEAV